MRFFWVFYPAGKKSSGEVLGVPLGKIPASLFQKIGFVADGRMPPVHWTVKRLTDYLRPLYPTWDDNFRDRLVAKFELPEDRPLSELSRGMKMKATLVGALAFRPELLVLDEPFSGLDPLTREEFIDGLLELMQDGDWSILLSSHDIREVERLCDTVAILDRGKLALHEDLESLQARFRQWIWRCEATTTDAIAPVGWLGARHEGGRRTGLQPDYVSDEATLRTLTETHGPISDITGTSLDLNSLLVAYLREAKAAK